MSKQPDGCKKRASNNTIVWALVSTKEGNKFWCLAETNGCDWVGVTAWDEYQNHNTFLDYGWEVVGWQAIVQPDLPE